MSSRLTTMATSVHANDLLNHIQRGMSPSRKLIESTTSSRTCIVDLGCGSKKLTNSVGVDKIGGEGVDVCLDIEKEALPFPDSSVDLVFSDNFLEHTSDLVSLITEIHRVLAPGGLMISIVPYFRSSFSSVDPTHKRFFTISTLDYFASGNYFSDNYPLTSFKFQQIYKSLEFMASKPSLPKRLLQNQLKSRALADPSRYENSWLSSAFPFSTIAYTLVK